MSEIAILDYIKTTLLWFIALLIVAIIIVIIRSREYLTWEYREKRRGTDLEIIKPSKMRRKWQALEKKADSKSASAYKLAVIEADKIIEDILTKAGYRGETMAERLKQITPANISNINDLWTAHRLRNTIAHDIDAKVSRREAKKAIDIFKETLEELQAL